MNNNPFSELYSNTGIRIAVMGVLSILALFLLSQTITAFGRSGVPATDTITVQGQGQATLPPDVAHVSFTVMHTANTVAEAQEATVKQADSAIEAVKSEGIADKDVKTLSYNISPQYSYPNPCPVGAICPAYTGSPKITGYQVSESIQITIRDLTKVGKILGKLGGLEVQNVNGPDFALDDSTAGYSAARADAINKAKEQAQMLASQLGVRLGKIVNFSESSGGYYYPVRAEMSYADGKGGAASTPAPTVPTGENTYSASVSVTYEIR